MLITKEYFAGKVKSIAFQRIRQFHCWSNGHWGIWH